METSLLIEASEDHFRAISKKETARIIELYAESEDLLVFVEGPRWATLGFENVAKGWRDFCASAITLKKCVWAENLRSKIVGKMGFVGGIVELTVEINDVIKTIRFRGTFIFENQNGVWKIVHEHFSQPAENPYGIGDWLKK